MTHPAKNETLEAFKQQMIEKHEVTLRASMDLVKISNEVLYEPFATPLHKVMRTIARVVVTSNGAVLTVATAGYGNDAAKYQHRGTEELLKNLGIRHAHAYFP